MRKSVIAVICNAILISCIITCLLLFYPYSSNIEASTISQESSLEGLVQTAKELSGEIEKLQSNLFTYEETLTQLNTRLTQIENDHEVLENSLVDYYIDHLKDRNYYSTYNENYIYYTAAENLGLIGKPAIPKLIEKLSTTDDYERTLTLYALLLASQADNVKIFAGDDYIQTALDFDSNTHPEQVKLALNWWEKYKGYFTS